MSQIVKQFDPSTAGTTEFAAPNSAANGALVFWNESNISVNLTFANGSIIYLPAWYHRHVCGATGDVNIQWATNTQLSSALPPMSAIIVESYAAGEKFPLDGPLVRQTNGDASVSNATSVTNTGFGINTQFLFAEVSGDTSGSFIATNDGTLQLGNTSENGQLTIKGRDLQSVLINNDFINVNDNLGNTRAFLGINGLSIESAAGPILATLGGAGKLSLNNAAGSTILSLDFNGIKGSGKGTLHFGQVAASDTLDTDGSGNPYFKSASTGTGSVNFQPNLTGTNILTVTNTKLSILNGAAIDFETAGLVLNGGTSGTATLIQDCIGLIKRVLIILNNFRTAGAAQSIALPAAFTAEALVRTGLIGTSATNAGVGFLAGVSNVQVAITTTLAAAGATTTSQNFIYAGSYGEVLGAFDTIQFQSGGTAAHTGLIIIEGQ